MFLYTHGRANYIIEPILLLAAPTSRARDDARAAGRFGSDMRHTVTDRTLTDLLGLPGMIVTEYAIEVQGYVGAISASGRSEVAPCKDSSGSVSCYEAAQQTTYEVTAYHTV